MSLTRERTVVLAIFFFATALMFMGDAQAAPFQDIPTAVNDALFDGANLYAAKMILSGAILMSALLALGMIRLPIMPILVMLLLIIGILVAIGWLDYWLLVLAAVIVALMFAKKVTEGLNADSSGGT